MHPDTPAIGPSINGLVGLLSARMAYLAAVKRAGDQHLPLPPSPPADKLAQADEVSEAIKTGIMRYGSTQEQQVMASFEEDPEPHEEILLDVLRSIAAREAAFAEHLQALALQTNTYDGSRYAGITR